ncbi:MAG: hypothetical protein ACRD1E_06965 [Terriglobales bacterium]
MSCSHRWVRARWDDGTYGLRCAACMRPYRRSWDEPLAPAPAAAPAREAARQACAA